jgi:hypothetical protein
MRSRVLSALLVAVLCAPTVTHPVAASEPALTSALFLDGETGDYIFGEQSAVFATPEFRVLAHSPDTSTVRLHVETPTHTPDWTWYDVELSAPRGEALAVGTYTGATRSASRQGTDPGIDVGGDGRGCNTTAGDFTIHEFERNEDGSVRALSASFRQWCGSTRNGSKLIGELRLASARPLPAYAPDLTRLTLPAQLVGTRSDPVALTIRNIGQTRLSGSVAVDGTHGSDFGARSVDDCLTSGFGPNESCVVHVHYVPGGQGTRSGSVAVSLDGLQGPRRWTVTGSGQLQTQTRLELGPEVPYPGTRSVTATVTPAGVAGFVRFLVDGYVVGGDGLGTGSTAGKASAGVVIPTGASSIRAEFVGTSTWAPSLSDPLPQQGQRAAGLHVRSSRQEVRLGQPVDVVAALLVAGPWPPSGRIRIVDELTNQEVAAGDISPTRPALGATIAFHHTGLHRLTASYLGDDLTTTANAVLDIRVTSIRTSVALQVPSTVHFPAAATVTARVSPVPDGGTVAFSTPDGVLGSVPVDPLTGVATLRLSPDPGAYAITAAFSGTAAFDAATSPTRTLVTTIATSTVVEAAPATACAGDPVDLTASVSGIPSGAPSEGRLVLRDGVGGTFLASATVSASNRRLTFSTTTLTAGEHTIAATYSGGGDYDASAGTTRVTIASGGDCTAPAGSVVIDGGSSYTRSTSVTLSLTASDPAPGSGVTQMSFSPTGTDGSWTGWIPFSSTHPWTLQGDDGAKWVYARFRDGAGNVSSAASAGVVLDRSPAVESVPSHGFQLNGQMATTTVPVVVSYPARDALSGVAAYRVEQSANAGTSYQPVALPRPSAPSVVRPLAPGSSAYRFRASARDGAGNVGAPLAGPAFVIGRYDDAHPGLRYTATGWAVRRDPATFLGAEHVARGVTARVGFTFTGSRLALVATRGPGRGKAETHTLDVRVLGTKRTASAGTWVGIDAFLVAR